ncbi:condensin complex protein MksE [Larkinella sp.]|uniref:condensin complex protein MksE n=1 Tax=Larkinella sp. TaxID=2034517 RepID=UPI003BA96D53
MADDRTKASNGYAFLTTPEAERFFGKLDYALKDGLHIQEKLNPDFYFFVDKNHTDLSNYYERLFEVKLERSQNGSDRYFYLDFVEANSRGSIVAEHRYFLAPEHIIVGFLLYKVIYNDLQIELDSVRRFQKMLREEYEDLKPLIYEKLAQVTRKKPSEMDDDKLNGIVLAAMREFGRIGWILLENDYFEPLPAFGRLTLVYGDPINVIGRWQTTE